MGEGAMSIVTSGPRVADADNEGQTHGAPNLSEGRPSVPLVAKVKLGMIISQAIDQEIPIMAPDLLTKAREGYIQACGDDPLPSCAATEAQLTAYIF